MDISEESRQTTTLLFVGDSMKRKRRETSFKKSVVSKVFVCVLMKAFLMGNWLVEFIKTVKANKIKSKVCA